MTRSFWNEWWKRRCYDVAAIGTIVVFFIAFFPQVFFGSSFTITGDAYFHSYPLRTVAWNMIRSGQLPLWTPNILGGYPLLSMAQVGLGYPGTWSYLFLPGLWAEQFYVLAPYLLSPIFTYAYLREINRSRLAALFGGLAFGYGGMMCGIISNSGILTNSLMWTPLVLLFVDRSQRRGLITCLPPAALAYSLSVLAGHPQSYVYAGVLIAAYGLYLSVFATSPSDEPSPTFWRRYQPLLVALGAMLLAAGVASFQLFESLRVARRSIRSELTYERFSEGSFSLTEAVLSLVAPLYHYIDSSPYLTPLALVLAVVATAAYTRRREVSDLRIWFWVATAVVSFLLLLGSNTPLNRIVFALPVLRQFRVPSRHTFEWTLAISTLAAFGWDWITGYARTNKSRSLTSTGNVIVAFVLLVLAIVVGIFWWKAIGKPPVPNPTIYTGLRERGYWIFKLVFTLIVVLLVGWCFLKLVPSRVQTIFLGAAIFIACFIEPAATVSCWWGGLLSLPAARLQLVSPTTRLLQQFPAAQNRVYTRTELFAEEFNPHPRLESANLHAVYGLHNIAGMEPLILERFSRALGGIGPDSVTPRAGYPANNDDLFSAHSHVLDLLNTTHVVSFANLKTFEDPLVYKDGVGLSVADLGLTIGPHKTEKLTGSSRPANQLAIVTSLANSVTVEQGATVAVIRITTADGQVKELQLRAGLETSEWAHDRPDVQVMIKHDLAPVFDSRPGEDSNFLAHRYWARLQLPDTQTVTQVEIENVTSDASLAISRATLYDSTTGLSSPVVRLSRSEFWQTIYSKDAVEVLENKRALPRAWLVAEATAVDGEAALRRIRGEGDVQFDPQRTALLEVKPTELPALPGGVLATGSTVRVVNYESNRIRYETNSPTATVLIASEIFYPGWIAEVDGKRVPILLADFLFRGVYLPAGPHTVELRYVPTAARNGSFISLFSIGLIVLLFIIRRRPARHAAEPDHDPSVPATEVEGRNNEAPTIKSNTESKLTAAP